MGHVMYVIRKKSCLSEIMGNTLTSFLICLFIKPEIVCVKMIYSYVSPPLYSAESCMYVLVSTLKTTYYDVTYTMCLKTSSENSLLHGLVCNNTSLHYI